MGSTIYHDLGLKFQSPTINMKFNANDWVSFIEKFNYYLQQNINFIKTSKPYPVGKIGNEIEVEFVHYTNEENVIDKWNERKENTK